MKEKLYTIYREICSQMDILLDSVENNKSLYIKSNAKRVVINSIRLDGYIECLCDMSMLSNDEIEKFSNFTKQIRLDVGTILSLYFELR